MTRIDHLRESIGLLAASSSDQINYLASIFRTSTDKIFGGFNADELVLQFDDSAMIIEDMLRQGEVSSEQRNAVIDMNLFLNKVTDLQSPEFWTVNALRTDPMWDDIRNKARDCLKLFHGNGSPRSIPGFCPGNDP